MTTVQSESPQRQLAPSMQKPIGLLNTTFELFGFLPHDSDPRWSFLNRFHTVRSASNFKPINFATACAATYLSDEQSYKTGFVTTILPENTLQLDRALDNLQSRQMVKECFTETSNDYGMFDMRLALTDRLTTDPTEKRREITPCPEALYQIRLFTRGSYLARVGFNIHHENGPPIISIVNIQGIPDGQEATQKFKASTGISPFNILVRRVVDISQVRTNVELRGLLNPKRGSSQLYWGVLTSENIPLFHAAKKEKPAISVDNRGGNR